ncbi:glucose 1-dehydrogenase [Rhodococcus sp. 14C212]|uniref:SDR family NAD(P)-dependent oxidoreductase n=1 Tax=Rhodococcus sp. 14C212 TaxID=2711209 RepID=UPI0013EC79FF|nr:glucose 1-dehydrogenase [Rhodococcus sp. 14C212]NGP06738.1 glucose 1-dehydrogenase [Rhodococcus sp. 14C212]
MQLMDGKAGLVTGAGSGIGRAGAIAFANHGGKVVVSDYNEESGQETVALINEAGGRADFFRCDVSEEDQVKALVDFTVSTYGALDFAFNNAGTDGEFAPIGEMDSAVFDRVMKINLYGVFYCMKHEVLAMEAGVGGAIVNTSSSNGLIGIPRNASYNASKFAVIGITKNVAIDYGFRGIRVNALAPGPTTTPMLTEALERHTPEFKNAMYASLPMRDLLRPEDQANAAVWLCSDQARMITGTTLAVDGGYLA